MSALGQNQTFSREHYNLPLESVVVHHNKVEPPMSALGQKRTSRHLQPMSALPPKADITERGWYVRYVPIADIMQRNKKGAQLVGGNLYRLRVPVVITTRCSRLHFFATERIGGDGDDHRQSRSTGSG